MIVVAQAYKIDIDFNTYTASELNAAANGKLTCDGTWTITHNSDPKIIDQQWKNAIAGVNPKAMSFSEDDPNQYTECRRVRNVSPNNALLSAFAYHETGGEPHTQLTWQEIDHTSNQCGGCGVIILTRAYWPNSEWRLGVERVLDHPKLYGVAIEYAPQDFGLRTEEEFVNEILAHGKSPFFLLPFDAAHNTEVAMTNLLKGLVQRGAKISDPRVHFVLARYGIPTVSVLGSSNSIQSALIAAKNFRAKLLANHSEIYEPIALGSMEKAVLRFDYRQKFVEALKLEV